jgi:hypothetical protein
LQPEAGHRFIDIDVLDRGFSPLAQQAFAGDVVRWTTRSASHNIVAYAPDKKFNSNPTGEAANVLKPGDVYCITYAGGSVWYRDWFSNTSVIYPSGVCDGRCGSISDRTEVPAAPSITTPPAPSSVRPSKVTGTSEPLTLVKIAEVPAGEPAYDKGTPMAQALAGENGAWTAYIDLTGGTHYFVARAVDAAGREGPDSTSSGAGAGVPTAFEVTADTAPPAVTVDRPASETSINQPNGQVYVNNDVTLTGTATDDIGVSRVEITVSDLRAPAQLVLGPSAPQSIVKISAACTPKCENAPQSATWSKTFGPYTRTGIGANPTNDNNIDLKSGIYEISVVAFDPWGNKSSEVKMTIVLLGREVFTGV